MESLENEISVYTKFPSYINVKFTNIVSEEISSNQITEEDSILKEDLQVADDDLSFKVYDIVEDGNHMPKSSYVSSPQSNPCYPKPKPAYSYLHLITLAFMNSSKEELSRSDIQRFIMKQFPYFKRKAPFGWKEVIMLDFKKHILRHLTGNEYFEKVEIVKSEQTLEIHDSKSSDDDLQDVPHVILLRNQDKKAKSDDEGENIISVNKEENNDNEAEEKVENRPLKSNECSERIENGPLKARIKWRMKSNKADFVIEELRTWSNRKFEKIKIGMNYPDSLPDLLKGKYALTMNIYHSFIFISFLINMAI